MRSRDISIEEWKGSETYSPNTAYGKTPALMPPAGAAGLGSQSQRPGQVAWPLVLVSLPTWRVLGEARPLGWGEAPVWRGDVSA